MITFRATKVVNGRTYRAVVTLTIIHQPSCRAESKWYMGGNVALNWCSCTPPRKEVTNAPSPMPVS